MQVYTTQQLHMLSMRVPEHMQVTLALLRLQYVHMYTYCTYQLPGYVLNTLACIVLTIVGCHAVIYLQLLCMYVVQLLPFPRSHVPKKQHPAEAGRGMYIDVYLPTYMYVFHFFMNPYSTLSIFISSHPPTSYYCNFSHLLTSSVRHPHNITTTTYQPALFCLQLIKVIPIST